MTKEKIELADRHVKSVVKEAKYMIKGSSYTTVFYPSEYKCIDEVENNLKYRYKMINGVLYETIYTNPYKELVALHKDRGRERYEFVVSTHDSNLSGVERYQQLTLFG